MTRKLTLFFLGLLGLFSFSAYRIAEDPFALLLKKLEDFAKKYPQEKVYLHLDKPYYAIGDDIWFKAYVVDSRTSNPTTTSNILYVELVNERDSVQKQLKLPMQAGITWGDFNLPDSLNEGNYRIRAYTQWMRNAGPAFFFDKTIKVGNSWANKVFTKTAYNYSTEKGNATIRFIDNNEKPYIQNMVTFNVTIDGKSISKGRTTTNTNGEIDIPTVNIKPSNNGSGNIIATITMADGKKVVKNIPIKALSNAVNVQFFPEGGNLVEGLPSKVAIKAINSNGLGEDISGRLMDSEGAEVLKFQTTYLGMGNLFFTPEPGKSYTAIIALKNGPEQNIPLPKAEKSGYIMSVNNTDSSKMVVRIALSPDLLNKGELHLVAQHNGEVYFAAKVATTNQVAEIIISKKIMFSGIIQLTLLDPSNLPVAERLAFVNHTNDKIGLDIQNLKTNYAKKENVSLDLAAAIEGEAIKGSFSVSVTNNAIVATEPENESNILTSLLLTSDLVGFVEKPNHYFMANDLKTNKELDNLLLTQGWRKIDWKKIDTKQSPEISFTAEKTIAISGTIKKSGKALADSKMILMSNSKGFLPIDTVTDASGHFSFSPLSFIDSTRFVVQARTIKDKANITIKLDSIADQLLTPNPNFGDIEVNVNEKVMDYLRESNHYFDEQLKSGFLKRTNMLKEIKIIAKPKQASKYSANLSGRADFIFDVEDLKKATSLQSYLPGRVPNTALRYGKLAILRFGEYKPMPIVLDGTILPDLRLEDVSVMNVESIEILKPGASSAIYGPRGQNGLVIITSKRGQNSFDMFAPGIIAVSPKGYYLAREFYSPKYEVNSDSKPDLRTTVYWNPNLITDENGKININYFNTDQSGTYRMLIEGIDQLGNLARKVYTYEVK